jgi:outer membrane lipoprotein
VKEQAMRTTEVRGLLLVLSLSWLAMLMACNRYDVIPGPLEKHLNQDLSFEQIQASPDQYKGELVVFGGEILSAKRLKDRTQIEVLQLPLTDTYVPIPERVQSKGRYLAFDRGKEITDPAILKEGTPITIIGEVTGSRTGNIGEAEYRYPVLVLRDMTVWNKDRVYAPRYPYWAYGGYYWYPYRPYYW